MSPWTFEVKFYYGTQFLFGTLMFTAEKDGTLELQTQGPTPSHHEPIYGEAPYYPVNHSTTSASRGARSRFNPYAGSYAPTAITSWGHPIGAPMSWSPVGTSSPSSSGTSTGRDSIEDYPEINKCSLKHTTEKSHQNLRLGA
jgi:hypothetical protein